MTPSRQVDAIDSVLVRTRSHRAAQKLERLLGELLEWWFTWKDGGMFVAVPLDRLDECRKIPGITKARPNGDPRRCWS